MNTYQKNYAAAKAAYEAAKEALNEAEAAFVRDNVPDEQRSQVTYLYMIEDDELFDRLCGQFESQHADLIETKLQAEKQLSEAENALIHWGLSIVPDEIRKVLEPKMNVLKYRQKVIDLSFKVDPKTCPG